MNNYLSHFLIAFEPALWVAIGVLTVVFWAALIVAIIVGSRDKQLRKQAREDMMEYRRHATAEEIAALKIKTGICSQRKDGCCGNCQGT